MGPADLFYVPALELKADVCDVGRAMLPADDIAELGGGRWYAAASEGTLE